MDETDLKSEDANCTRANREYGWFAIALFCITARIVITLHT
jgi:hypothetical protein